MAEENLRIDQLTEGVPKTGDWGIFRDMDASKTKRYKIGGSVSGNFEWSSVSAAAGDYDIGHSVTYGGNWYQSTIDNNESVPGVNATWTLLTRGVNFSRWAASAYVEDDIFVIRLIDGEDHLVQLVDAARPYVSEDFDVEYAAGDWVSLSQNKINKAATDGVNTIQLDMNYLKERNFNLVAVVTEAKTWSILKGTNLKKLTVTFEIDSGLDVHTFPATFKLWTIAGIYDGGTFTWTPLDPGKYELEITFDGTTHYAKLFGPFN